jgi:signal peptidase I
MINWFLSKTVRQASALRKHVQKLLDHQRDILPPTDITAIETSLASLQAAIASNPGKEALEKEMDNVARTADKSLRPYPNAAWRENVEVLLVALTVAMGIRTFFLQPFKIPTGSMQPSLFGVTSEPNFQATGKRDADFVVPSGWARVREWFGGVSYVNVKANVDGELERINAPFKILIFNIYQTLVIGGKTHWIWFPPDYGDPQHCDHLERAGLPQMMGSHFSKGDQVVRLKVVSGDHLFVDRVSYNFVKPKRGEIIVFETKGINGLPQDQFYIKRMVAMGGEKVQIGDDRHLIINGQRLDSTVPHFEKVYSFNPNLPPRESQYSGHVNQKVADQFYPYMSGQGVYLAPLFPNGTSVFDVAPDHFMVMGDNTMNSRDSREWGDFPANNVIGKSFFVYWPLTDRFGWGYHR